MGAANTRTPGCCFSVDVAFFLDRDDEDGGARRRFLGGDAEALLAAALGFAMFLVLLPTIQCNATV